MNPEIERLIDLAIKGNVVTPRQREIIRIKAISLGEDPDEAELILDLTVKKNGGLHEDEDEKETIEASNVILPYSNESHAEFPNETIQSQKLHRKTDGKVLFGVCAGIAERYGISPLIVRLVFFLFYFISIWVYIVMALTLPKDY